MDVDTISETYLKLVSQQSHVISASFYPFIWLWYHHNFLWALSNYEVKQYTILSLNRSTKRQLVIIDSMVGEARFLAFQRWFLIENRSTIKETMVTFVNFGQSWYHQTMGVLLLGEVLIIIRDNAVLVHVYATQS